MERLPGVPRSSNNALAAEPTGVSRHARLRFYLNRLRSGVVRTRSPILKPGGTGKVSACSSCRPVGYRWEFAEIHEAGA